MKKIMNAACFVIVATMLLSCQKQNDLAVESSSATAARQTNINNSPGPGPAIVPFILSQWFPGNLMLGKNGGIYGYYILNQPLPAANDSEIILAYVRRQSDDADQSAGGLTYHQLAMKLNTVQGYPALMSFEMSTYLFEIFINPIGLTGITLDPQEFNDCGFRYIVISKEFYSGLNIDWSDYLAVARSLNFTP